MKKILLAALLLITTHTFGQVKIRIVNLSRDIAPDTTGTITFTAEFNINVPQIFITASGDIQSLAESYKNVYPIDRVTLIQGDAVCSFRKSYTLPIRKADGSIIDDAYLQTFLEGKYAEFEYGLSNFQPMPFDGIIGRKFINGIWQ